MLTLALTACGGSAGAGEGGGEGVALGATKDEYAAALADMDPVELRLQSAVPEGQGTSVGFAAYAEALNEWSGGKISVKPYYSASIAKPGDDVDAFNDGRLDLGIVVSGASPERFPLTPVWVDADQGGISDARLDWLSMQLSTLERGFASEEFMQEYENEGIQVILPYLGSDDTGLLCREPFSAADDLRGRTVRIGSPSQRAQTDKLGMTPVSLPFTELYEGLQRNVVDCVFTPLGFAKASGLIPLASNWIGAAQNTGGVVGSPFGVSKQVWDGLPLAARQLLHDRLDVYVGETLRTSTLEAAEAFAMLRENGGGIQENLDSSVTDALKDAANSKLDAVRRSADIDGEALITAAEESRAKWLDLLGGAGYEKIAWGDDLVEWVRANPDLEFNDAMDLFVEEVLNANRPEK
ncbi:hypothetical protein GQ85_03465 [Rhodococcus rhodochrous]|nr:hypothetical protein GQ85_03465 [Rhodococcus rhodochrous]